MTMNKSTHIVYSIEELFKHLTIEDNTTISFHHHLRNGDYVSNMVCDEILNNSSAIINVAPSSIFPVHTTLNELIQKGRVKNIYTSYINGPVADSIGKGMLKGSLFMLTHGGRARAIENNVYAIDIAFIAASECDKLGNANGLNGKSACGPLGYAIADMLYASKVVVICDNLVEEVKIKEIMGEYVDYILVVERIGDPNGIVSGTTQITKNPVGLKIARDTKNVIQHSGLLKEGMSFQTGAGGTSLAVAAQIRSLMISKKIRGSFASGGITKYFVQMLRENLIDEIWDVQSFDLDAIVSAKMNPKHHVMSASKYANPDEDSIAKKLDVVVLGATEVDVDFNVNVTTDSSNNIIGGSGGHCDTATGAKLTIITTPLIRGRIPAIRDRVNTITTPGISIDVVVTERGIAVNPLRQDLIAIFKKKKMNVKTIEELKTEAYKICGIPEELKKADKIIGYSISTDGQMLDPIYMSKHVEVETEIEAITEI